jgi:hypothetical protein
MSNKERLKLFCNDCKYRKNRNKCPMAHKDMCPDYVAFKISMVLEDETTAQLVPTDLLIKALRSHGYTGELRKTTTITI